MLKTFALVAFVAILALCLPAWAEPGDVPHCPHVYMTVEEIHAMEELRQRQAVGGVTGSPYWLWQAYLCGRSLQLRVYDVREPLFPEQILFKERISWANDGTENKRMAMTVEDGTTDVELRIDRFALAKLEESKIISMTIRDRSKNELASYNCADIEAIFDYFQLAPCETLCLQGADDPVYALSCEGVKRAISGI